MRDGRFETQVKAMVQVREEYENNEILKKVKEVCEGKKSVMYLQEGDLRACRCGCGRACVGQCGNPTVEQCNEQLFFLEASGFSVKRTMMLEDTIEAIQNQIAAVASVINDTISEENEIEGLEFGLVCRKVKELVKRKRNEELKDFLFVNVKKRYWHGPQNVRGPKKQKF